VTANCTSNLQARPLVSEGAPRYEGRKCSTVLTVCSYVAKELELEVFVIESLLVENCHG
jgi:hypothetical protein